MIVGLNGTGQFDIRNAKGEVHVIINVSAYLVEQAGPSPVVVPAAAFRSDGNPADYFDNFSSMLFTGSGTSQSRYTAPVTLPAARRSIRSTSSSWTATSTKACRSHSAAPNSASTTVRPWRRT